MSDCQMVKRDSSLQRKRFHCSRVQWWRALHHTSQCIGIADCHLRLVYSCSAIISPERCWCYYIQPEITLGYQSGGNSPALRPGIRLSQIGSFVRIRVFFQMPSAEKRYLEWTSSPTQEACTHPPLLSILLANVQSLDEKVDELWESTSFQRGSRNCNIFCFTANMALSGYTV